MILKMDSHFLKHAPYLLHLIKSFKSEGILFGNGKRNTLKIFDLEDITIIVKSFKIPNVMNQVIYKYFRKSKARRSYENAITLLEKGIGTPQPIAYFENFNALGLKDSYYVCEHLVTELSFRELITIPDYPDYETILRQFTRFSFDLHEKGIEFLDHSPGNTLIKKVSEHQYDFFLVDLNRMNFLSEMDFDSRMKNFGRLTPKKEMIAIMSDEYSKCYSAKDQGEIYDTMWKETCHFREGFERKKRIKKKLKF